MPASRSHSALLAACVAALVSAGAAFARVEAPAAAQLEPRYLEASAR